MMLNKLWLLAREHGYKDLMKVFQARLDELKSADLRKAENERVLYDCWRKIQTAVTHVGAEAQELTKEGHPAGKMGTVQRTDVAYLASAELGVGGTAMTEKKVIVLLRVSTDQQDTDRQRTAAARPVEGSSVVYQSC